jgi:hypothetical protein
MAMASDFIRTKNLNFPTTHKRITDDVLIHTSKIALVHLMALIFESLSHLRIK